MNAVLLLEELLKQGIKITLFGAKLCVHAPIGAITPSTRQRLKIHKKEILELCSSPTTRLAIESGGEVLMWSQLLSDWLYLVKDERVAEKLRKECPGIAVYTEAEASIIANNRWPEGQLKEAHRTKKICGGRIISLRNELEPPLPVAPVPH